MSSGGGFSRFAGKPPSQDDQKESKTSNAMNEESTSFVESTDCEDDNCDNVSFSSFDTSWEAGFSSFGFNSNDSFSGEMAEMGAPKDQLPTMDIVQQQPSNDSCNKNDLFLNQCKMNSQLPTGTPQEAPVGDEADPKDEEMTPSSASQEEQSDGRFRFYQKSLSNEEKKSQTEKYNRSASQPSRQAVVTPSCDVPMDRAVDMKDAVTPEATAGLQAASCQPFKPEPNSYKTPTTKRRVRFAERPIYAPEKTDFTSQAGAIMVTPGTEEIAFDIADTGLHPAHTDAVSDQAMNLDLGDCRKSLSFEELFQNFDKENRQYGDNILTYNERLVDLNVALDMTTAVVLEAAAEITDRSCQLDNMCEAADDAIRKFLCKGK